MPTARAVSEKPSTPRPALRRPRLNQSQMPPFSSDLEAGRAAPSERSGPFLFPFRSTCAESIRTPGSQLAGVPRSYRADKQIAVDPARFTTKNSSPKRNPAQG